MSYTVKFTDVGRGKRSWTATLQAVDESALAREVARSKALASRGIECSGGIVYAGFHAVGRYEVVDGPKGKVLNIETRS